MSLVTIGLDFGTSSIKCVARAGFRSNREVAVLRSPSGSIRWRSMLGKVREGSERGRLLLFEECDEPRWRFHALLEPNLKLALLVAPAAPAAAALRDRWRCETHYAPAVVLLAAAVQQSLVQARNRLPSKHVHIFCGAPVSPQHPRAQTVVFERALHAARNLAERWGNEVPRAADEALRSAEEAWFESENLPADADRTTRIVPEAFAAVEGAASSGGGLGLPIGRLCVVDMGGGTTDLAWLTSGHDGVFIPHHIESFDIAGERLEAVISSHASLKAKRRVSRQEIWSARAGWRAGVDAELRGDGWSFDIQQLQEMLNATLLELRRGFQQAIGRIDRGYGRSPSTGFVFVGGATLWPPLMEMFLDSIQDLHTSADVVSVKGFGLEEEVGESPIAVALGLSYGYTRLHQDRWQPALANASDSTVAEEDGQFRECSCRGLLPCCPRCGGSGAVTSEHGLDRFAGSIDPFSVHSHAVRCPHCLIDFPRDRIFEHLSLDHGHAFQPLPARAAPMVGQTKNLTLRVEAVRGALRDHDMRTLTDAEQYVVSMLRLFERGCFQPLDSGRVPNGRCEIAKRFLQNSVPWIHALPWVHLPRAVAFGILGDQEGVESELEQAESAGLGYVEGIDSVLSSSRSTRFAEAWEHAIR